jgi:VWFA-related protein
MFPARFLWLSSGCLAAVLASPASEQAALRPGGELIRVHATVRSDEGRLIPAIGADQFEIRVDGKPVPVASFSNDAQALTLVLMVDLRGGMRDRLLWSRDAGLALVDALRSGDRLRIGAFGRESQLSPGFTGDPSAVRRTLMEELWPEDRPTFWSDLYAGLDWLTEESGRRAVVAISNGGDVDTRIERQLTSTVMTDALAGGVIIYAIGAKDKGLGVFRPIAQRAGGGHIAFSDTADVRAVMREVVNELRLEYLIGFVPPVLDGRTHDLSVRVRLPEATAVAARRFTAPAAPK